MQPTVAVQNMYSFMSHLRSLLLVNSFMYYLTLLHHVVHYNFRKYLHLQLVQFLHNKFKTKLSFIIKISSWFSTNIYSLFLDIHTPTILFVICHPNAHVFQDVVLVPARWHTQTPWRSPPLLHSGVLSGDLLHGICHDNR